MSFYSQFVAIALIGITACGYTPVYAPGLPASDMRGRIIVAEPDDPDSYVLVRELEQRLGQPDAPAYRLAVQLDLGKDGQVVTETAEITRYNITGRTTYGLVPIGAENPVFQSTVQSFTSYSAKGSTLETIAAERDSRDRLMVILADQITTELHTLPDLPR